MKIAILAPPWFAVPPSGYGGIEWIVWLLADGLADQDHDVTLFASGDSHTKAKLEAVFEHADVFDIGRERKPDVAFGFGPHYCLGASLATLEAEVALRVLLARTRRFRRVDDVPLPIPPSIVFRGVTRLPVVLERA